MSRSTVVTLALSAVVMAGAASAQTSFKARFDIDRQATAEENYIAFEDVARRACVASVKEANGMMDKARIQHDCTARLLGDAVKAVNDAGLSMLHAERTGASATVLASRD